MARTGPSQTRPSPFHNRPAFSLTGLMTAYSRSRSTSLRSTRRSIPVGELGGDPGLECFFCERLRMDRSAVIYFLVRLAAFCFFTSNFLRCLQSKGTCVVCSAAASTRQSGAWSRTRD